MFCNFCVTIRLNFKYKTIHRDILRIVGFRSFEHVKGLKAHYFYLSVVTTVRTMQECVYNWVSRENKWRP